MQASDEIWGLPVQPAEAAANMLIARVGFDLLRSPTFQAAASAYVQKKLDQLRLPPYIGPLKVQPLAYTTSVHAQKYALFERRLACAHVLKALSRSMSSRTRLGVKYQVGGKRCCKAHTTMQPTKTDERALATTSAVVQLKL